MKSLVKHKQAIEDLYARSHRRSWVHPDPLEFLYRYGEVGDREVAGLVAAVLAYGRVGQILRSVSVVLDRLGPSPRDFLLGASMVRVRRTLAGFRHRFSTGAQLAGLLEAMRSVIRQYGSLQACFLTRLHQEDQTVLAALTAFVGRLDEAAGGLCGHLLPDPAKGSACKRYHLYLRWMVRCDEVDPGGWEQVGPERLIVPMDTHMHRIALALGATRRKTADLRAALETTDAFRTISPHDPVKYDFTLTRLGIHPAADEQAFLARCGVLEV